MTETCHQHSHQLKHLDAQLLEPAPPQLSITAALHSRDRLFGTARSSLERQQHSSSPNSDASSTRLFAFKIALKVTPKVFSPKVRCLCSSARISAQQGARGQRAHPTGTPALLREHTLAGNARWSKQGRVGVPPAAGCSAKRERCGAAGRGSGPGSLPLLPLFVRPHSATSRELYITDLLVGTSPTSGVCSSYN